jgi:hypothetical protein
VRRLRFVLITALWIGAVTWYWNTSVPLAPTRSVPAPPGQRFYGISPANEVIVCATQMTTTIPPRYIGCGPLEFWKFPEGVKTRTLFAADDEIVCGPRGKTRDFLLRRDGALCIVDSETGRQIATLPDIPDAYECRVLGNYERVLIAGKRDIHFYDIRSESLIWTANELYIAPGARIGDDFFIAGGRVPGKSGFKTNDMAISLATGQPEPRFDHLGKATGIELSPDRQLALVRTSAAVTICDAATGSVRWTAPESPARANFKFNRDGSEIHITHFTPGSLATHSRCRTVDGQPLPDPTHAELLRSTGQVTQDGKYALLHVSRSYGAQISRLIDQLNLFFSRWNVRAHFRSNTPQTRLIETETERVLGFFRGGGGPITLFLRENAGVVSIADGQIHFYTLPPSRNWVWLVLWSLCPLAVVLLVPRFWKTLRARRVPAGGPV